MADNCCAAGAGAATVDGAAAVGADLPGSLAVLSSVPGGLAALTGEGAGGLGLPKPFSQTILLLEHIHVAGTSHVHNIQELVGGLTAGVELALKRDPLNAHDQWCVQVLVPSGARIGYLPCDCNEVIARLMDAGKRCFAKVVGLRMVNGWAKIDIEVYLDD